MLIIRKITYLLITIFTLLSFTIKLNAQQELWGLVDKGGKDGIGTVIKIAPDGTAFEKVFDFLSNAQGKNPRGSLLLSKSGIFYGVTEKGGEFDFGILFSFDPSTKHFKTFIDFDGNSTGRNPCAGLTEAANGLFYGTTSYGGSMDVGVLYEFDPVSGFIRQLMSFDKDKGSHPFGSLLEHTNGKLYGMTSKGGTSDLGVVFEFDPQNETYKKLIDFNKFNGANPYGGFTSVNEEIYGLTSRGGLSDNGTMFRINPVTSMFEKIFDFDDKVNGSHPFGTLLLASDQLLYGVTYDGGSYDLGVLFQLDPAKKTFTTKHHFEGMKTGKNPYDGLTDDSKGNIYGVTYLGGANNQGVLFSYNLSTQEITKRMDFSADTYGSLPQGRVVFNNDESLYGLTLFGGISGRGVLYTYDPLNSNAEKIVDFDGALNGKLPTGSFIQDTNGNLLGMTQKGGIHNNGILFEVDPYHKSFYKIFDFERFSTGSGPRGKLIFASNGKYYGVTEFGGLNNEGVFFEYDPGSRNIIKKHDFVAKITGANPTGILIQHTNGKIYGLTQKGGLINEGSIFEYDLSTEILKLVFDFNSMDGKFPLGGLLMASDEILYGTASLGGINNNGTIFSFDPVDNGFKKLYDFADKNFGVNPTGELVGTDDGKILGLTSKGGSKDEGVIFELDPTIPELNLIIDLSNTDGRNPLGGLTEYPDGTLFAFTQQGGKDYLGNIVQLDRLIPSVKEKHGFSDIEGALPGGSLIMINKCPATLAIKHHPASIKACEGTEVNLYAEANGTGPVQYHWFQNGESLGVYNQNLYFDNIQLEDSGFYYVEVADNCGTITSQMAEISVIKAEFWYSDSDGDGFGDPATQVVECTQPAMTVNNNLDCNDDDPYIYPGAPTLPDGKDNNCDGTIDKLDQIIIFEEVGNIPFDIGSFDLTATCSSDLEITFSSASDKIIIVDNVATIHQPGSLSILATQPGDSGYSAAQVSQEICIIPPKPTIEQSGTGYGSLLISSSVEGNQWFLNAQSLTGEISHEINLENPGNYTVQVSIDNCPPSEISEIFTVNKFQAGIEIIGNDFVYDGNSKAIQFSTDPEGLNVNITYNTSSVLPVNAGLYDVQITIEDDIYDGIFTSELVIEKAQAEIIISELEQIYDGENKQAKIETKPEGLEVEVLYNGMKDLPVESGTYSIRVTIIDENYQGIDEAVLIIDPLGLEEKIDSSVVIYPNPTKSGLINLELDQMWNRFEINIINLEGKILQTFKDTKTIDLTNYNGNAFLIHIKDDGKEIIKRIFKF